ncbi:hypothetical protein M885DRAFT_449765 [Pelagophyceae sp. CCMP2097]|nr:hypothetical protein M885DRAFT_449765 [Pelagophyceae sp. CCMP2097]
MTSEGGDADEWLADAGDERYFPLQCRRGETLLKDAMDAVRGASDDDLGRELRVAFAGEPGVDEGGVRREFLELVAAKTFDEAHFDAVESSRLWFANADGAKLKTVQGLGSTPAEFVRFAGTLCGLALTHGHTLQSCRLPTVAYAAILAARPADVDARARGAREAVALPTLLEYLAELDGGLAYGLRQLVDFEPPSAVEETFLYAFEWDGSELFPGGASVAVTALNRRRFARLVSLRLLGARNALLRDFAAGFWRTGARASTLHHLLGPADLRDALEGRDAALDWAELRPQARYDGWGAEPELHPVISAFWATLAALDEAESKNLLKFVTGSAAAPIGGLAALRPPQHAPFRIQRNGADSDHLPTTHVCFHTLLLPDYDPPTKLQRLLKRAIHECEGFGLR